MSEPATPPNANQTDAAPETSRLDPTMLTAAEKLIGLIFTDDERQLMLKSVDAQLTTYEKLRSVALPNSLAPALYFNPTPAASVSPAAPRKREALVDETSITLPDNIEAVAFYPVSSLAQLLKTGQLTSVALTEIYLDRLKRHGPTLECIVTLTEELALQQARQADTEMAAGHYRGPLHGIPWGAKDLLSTRGIKTTWGAKPYEAQLLDMDATVVQRLAEAGAVLVAKLTMGALAWGDVWFGGKTKSPWNVEEGSSGSSAGSGAATAAGLVGFAIGTETYGSIVSPSTRCGLSGLRPTFGRVSRHGAMALSWSMDKIGPMCRAAEDCALVFEAIAGPDGFDLSVVDQPFGWEPELSLPELRVGYVKEAFEQDYNGKDQDARTLAVLESLGVQLIPIDLPAYPIEALEIILSAEAAAAFDDLTRSNRDDLLVRQVEMAWPNRFRAARMIPAVEYLQANRVRSLLIQEMSHILSQVDLYVAPSFSNNLLLTNLTGHPAVVVPNGFGEKGLPTTITFTGRLYDEATILAVAKAYQTVTDFHQQHPPAFLP